MVLNKFHPNNCITIYTQLAYAEWSHRKRERQKTITEKKSFVNLLKSIEPKANANEKNSIECKQCAPLIKALTHPKKTQTTWINWIYFNCRHNFSSFFPFVIIVNKRIVFLRVYCVGAFVQTQIKRLRDKYVYLTWNNHTHTHKAIVRGSEPK